MTQRLECDLVMKGGITSGIVYPPLVLKLKDKYHFRSIGGTSAGAISAAATAAAEHGREQGGFQKLDELKNQLRKGTFLRDLFQPSEETRPLMNVLLDFIGRSRRQPSLSILQVILGLTESLLRHTPFIFVIGALLGAGLTYLLVALVGGSVSGWRIIFPILAGWLGALLAGVIYLTLILTQKVPENFLGLCTGRRDDSEKEDLTVLTDWLNDWLNNLAGIQTREEPLTFGDLRCKKFGDERDNGNSQEDNITLRMVTSNLSQNQPYVLPFKDDLFIFNEDDFKKLFPKQILNYLKDPNTPKATIAKLPEGYYFLPETDYLPVIVATRMSLSFPILLSAVRLYTIKPNIAASLVSSQDPIELKADDLQVNWFSDGGICSNFPIHFFDSWLPTRPTLGVNLTSMPEEQLTEEVINDKREVKVKLDYISPTSNQVTTQLNTNAIYLPKADDSSATEFIPLEEDLIKEDENRNVSVPVPNLLRFLKAIFSTAQNYRDNAQSVLPSYRERIVQVRLRNDEGGLNLAMPQSTIDTVIDKGEEAGEVLLKNFDFKIHQWIRFRVLMKLMETSIYEMDKVIRKHSIYSDVVNQQLDHTTFPYHPSDSKWLCEVADRLSGIGNHVESWTPPDLFAKEPLPSPEPVLRVMPEL